MSGGETQIYQDLMRFKPDDLTPNAWAVKSGVSRTVWTDMRRHGNPSRKTLEKLLSTAGSSLAEFEALRLGQPPARHPPNKASELGDVRGGEWAGASIPPIPLVASASGGFWSAPDANIELTEVRGGEILGRLPRPQSLAGNPRAFAFTVVGESMWPRFRPGRRLIVSPGSSVDFGDDVFVGLAGSGHKAMIKELVRMTGHYLELRQFNPDLTFKVPASDVALIHKIVGELI